MRLPIALRRVALSIALCGIAATAAPASGAEETPGSAPLSDEDLAKLKQNPVSGLRQALLDASVSPDVDGTDDVLGVYSFQVVWPFPLSEDLRLISYTILPALQLPGVDGESSEFGLGDTLVNLFVAPQEPGELVWGLGPAVLLPTRTDPELGTNRVGLGPSAVLYYATGAWGVGAVVQNVWSLGGSGANEVDELGLQYLFNYNLPRGWYLYSNATITADWTARREDRWTVPIGGGVGKVFQLGGQSMSLSFQGFWNADAPRNAPSWTLNSQLALLFP